MSAEPSTERLRLLLAIDVGLARGPREAMAAAGPRQDERLDRLRRECRTLLRAAIQESGGIPVEPGPHLRCAGSFPTASAALAAMAAARSAMAGREQLQLRMALDVAGASERLRPERGSLRRLNLLRIAAPWEWVLLSAEAAAAIEKQLPAGLRLRCLGAHRLERASEPRSVFQLVEPERAPPRPRWAEEPERRPPPRWARGPSGGPLAGPATMADYDDLGEEARQFFRRLSVFAGGCTLEAAESVLMVDCGSRMADCPHQPSPHPQSAIRNPPRRNPHAAVAPALDALVAARLLERVTDPDGAPRWMMAAGWRRPMQTRCRKAGEAGPFGRRHAGFFLALVDRAGAGLRGPRRAYWLERVAVEHANLLAALEWAAEYDPEAGLRLARGLSTFWEARLAAAG
jgi:hypothetical protein